MRLWNGYEDLRAMQEVGVEHRRLRGARAPWHIGGLAWVFRQHANREHEWTVKLWEDDGRVVAWSRLAGGDLDFDVHPEHRRLFGEILDEPEATHAFATEDDADALAEHGFATPAEVMGVSVRPIAEPPDVPDLPEGFRLRAVEADDLAERVEVHRDVWAPSRVTEESYANVMATWPYRGSLDCVVEAPGGRFAAFCLLWPDDDNGVAELEPVGVREEFRRLGLGAAVCTYALRRWHEEGGREAIVATMAAPALALYRSIGFEHAMSMRGYER